MGGYDTAREHEMPLFRISILRWPGIVHQYEMPFMNGLSYESW